MAVYAYVRVSTGRQDLESQRHAILEFANQKKLGPVTFVEETASGRIVWKKRKLGELVDIMLPADVLIVNELSRLGRSILEIMELLSILTRSKIEVYAIKGNYELGDNIHSKVIAFAFSIAAEIERELISGRTKDALAAKKASGKPLGKPKGTIQKSGLDEKIKVIQELLNVRVPKAAIARVVGTSRTNLLRYLKSRDIKPVKSSSSNEVGNGDTVAA